jgi:hypothetical protein
MNNSIVDVWINAFRNIRGGGTIGDGGARIKKRRGDCGACYSRHEVIIVV